MRRWIPLALLVMSACEACAAAPVPRLNYSTNVEYVTHESSVRILMYCLDGSGTIGSGTAVSSDVIITARHVVNGCGAAGVAKAVAITLDGIEHQMITSRVSDTVDVATMVSLEVSPFKVWARLAWHMPGLGDQVCWVSGDGMEQNRGYKKCGYYGGPRIGADDGYDIVSGKPAPGNSGSGVFNSRGELVGVLVVGRWFPTYDFLTGIVPVAEWRGLV